MQSIHIRVPDEIHDALRKKSFESRRSMNRIIVDITTSWAFEQHRLEALADMVTSLVTERESEGEA